MYKERIYCAYEKESVDRLVDRGLIIQGGKPVLIHSKYKQTLSTFKKHGCDISQEQFFPKKARPSFRKTCRVCNFMVID